MKGFSFDFKLLHKNISLIKTLVKSKINSFLMESLMKAAALGNVSHLLDGLQTVQNIDAVDENGWTALMVASRHGHLDVAKRLVDKGCDTGLFSRSGLNAQDIAQFWQHSEVARFLSTCHTKERPSNFLCDNPLDRLHHKRADDLWLSNAQKHPRSTYIVFSQLLPLTLKKNSQNNQETCLARFDYQTVQKLASLEKDIIFLGVEPHQENPESGWFAVESDLSSEQLKSSHDSYSVLPHYTSFKDLPRSEAAVAGLARSLLVWHQRTLFCSLCGQPSLFTMGGFKRTCSNHDCLSNKEVYNTCYPRIDPSVIMAITCPKNERLLLAQNVKRGNSLFWSVLAGFIEPGESIEEACRREVREETGLELGSVHYHSSQPWPVPNNLMIGCIGRASSNHLVIDESELRDARWFNEEEIQLMVANKHPSNYVIPSEHTISFKLITHWLSSKKQN